MKFTLVVITALTGTSLFAAPASERYVDDAANETLRAAKAYVDSHGGGGSGASAEIVTNISSAVTSNVVTKSYVESLGIEAGVTSVNGETGSVQLDADDVGAIPSDGGTVIGSLLVMGTLEGETVSAAGSIAAAAGDVTATDPDSGTTHSLFAKANSADVTTAIATNAADIAQLQTDMSVLGDIQSSISTIGTQMNAIGASIGADNAHFVSTNYDSVVRLPEAYVEVKIRNQETGSNTWVTIWQEMRRWTAFVGSAFDWQNWGGFHTWATNVTTQLSWKADRCWGIYDSETGGYSPEGYTQISSSNILIAAGMAYQRTITSDGAVWVLQCNQGVAQVGGDTNGFFRVLDGEGNVQFEIIKGGKREMGADAVGITVDNSTSPPTVTVPYSVESETHPTIQVCDNLKTANWLPETDADCIANVAWSGSSGAWVATVQRKTSGTSLFVKATFTAGGETYIRNVAPVGMDSIILNGTRYYLGTATISGHTVITLSTTAP